MLPTENLLEARLSRDLGVHVLVSTAVRPVSVGSLTPAERGHLDRRVGAAGREPWLLGRAALKRLLRRLGREPDTASFRFPNPSLSLTHSGPLAVAVTLGQAARGLGVDFEVQRTVAEKAARFFLRAPELRFIESLDPASRSRPLLRLWTVKEALFKANPGNTGTLLADYLTADPGALRGLGGPVMGCAWPYVYCSMEGTWGVLTVAVNRDKGSL